MKISVRAGNGVRATLAVLAGLVVLIGGHSKGRFLRADLLVPLVLVVAAGVAAGAMVRRGGRDRFAAKHVALLALFALCLLHLVSSATASRWFFFLRWLPGPEGFLRSGFAHFLLTAVALQALFLLFPRRQWLWPLAILLVSEALCVRGLLHTAGGQVLYRDDHPSFLFRLWEFGRCFPRLVNYNPYWNAGTLHYADVTTGVAGPGLVLWPLLRFFQPHEIYNAGVAFIFIFLVPWAAVLSVRAMGASREGALAAGCLALGAGQQFFLWMYHYGTVGSAMTCAMILPVSAWAFRAVWLGRRGIGTAVGLVLGSLFLLWWPPGALMGGAVGISLFFSAKRLNRRTRVFLLSCAFAVVLLYGRWLAVLFGAATETIHHVLHSPGTGGSGAAPLPPDLLAKGWDKLLAYLVEGNPLLVFLGVIGAITTPQRSVRRWFVPTLLVLAALTGWSEMLKPQSQMSRMGIPLFFLGVAPAAVQIGALLRARDARVSVVQGLLAALLAMTGISAARTYANQGPAPTVVKGDLVDRIVEWIRGHTPENGRVMFAGCTVHAVGRGHVAYLPVLTGREMLACDYYAFPPQQVEYSYPPINFRKPEEKMVRFLDVYNVSHIVTFHERWKQYFRKRPGHYTEEGSVNEFTFFRVKRECSPLLKGKGRVRADFNRIEVELDEPADEVILCYNWLDGLRSRDGVELFACSPMPGLDLVGVRPFGRKRFTLEFDGHAWW